MVSRFSVCLQQHRKTKPFIKDNQIIVNVGKGIEENTLMALCEILEDELPMADVCVLSGPSHAEEVSMSTNNGCSRSKDGKDGNVCTGCVYE